MSKTDNTSFEDFKNQVAVKRGAVHFQQCVDDHWPLETLINEAATLFVESEIKRIEKEAFEAGFNRGLLEGIGGDKQPEESKESQDEITMSVCVECFAIEKIGVSKVIKILNDKFNITRK